MADQVTRHVREDNRLPALARPVCWVMLSVGSRLLTPSNPLNGHALRPWEPLTEIAIHQESRPVSLLPMLTNEPTQPHTVYLTHRLTLPRTPQTAVPLEIILANHFERQS